MDDELEYIDVDLLIELLESEDEYDLKKSIMCIAREISNLNKYKEFAHQLIPMKYKKVFPKPGENPFFEMGKIGSYTPSKEERDASLKRMEKIMREI